MGQLLLISASYWYSNVENLETLGDIFSGAASMIDVLLCDVSIDDGILLLPILDT